jgi:hypothetical protein
MSYFHDFTTAMQDWRETEAALGHDPEGDRQAIRENARFLRETHSDSEDYAEPVKPKVDPMQGSLNFGEVA